MQPERSFAAHPPRVPRRRLFGVRSRRGQSLVEMALILPILLLLVGGIIQFGMLFWTQNTLTQIARDTGRWAATQTACGPAEVSAIQNQADAIAAQSSLLGRSVRAQRHAHMVWVTMPAGRQQHRLMGHRSGPAQRRFFHSVP